MENFPATVLWRAFGQTEASQYVICIGFFGSDIHYKAIQHFRFWCTKIVYHILNSTDIDPVLHPTKGYALTNRPTKAMIVFLFTLAETSQKFIKFQITFAQEAVA